MSVPKLAKSPPKSSAKVLHGPFEREIMEGVAADFVDLREKAGKTQEEVAEALDHRRSWLNKLEKAKFEVSLASYLAVVGELVGDGSDHPAVALKRYLKLKRQRSGVVPSEKDNGTK